MYNNANLNNFPLKKLKLTKNIKYVQEYASSNN